VTTPASVDIGYWTGSFTHWPSMGPQAGQPIQVSIGTGPDANGIAWLWEKIDGWDSPDVSGGVIQRGADHGGWPALQTYAPRAMTVTVRASAPTQYLRDVARAILQRVIPVNELCLMQYNEPIPKQMWVRRSGRIPEAYDNLLEVDFSCVLIAPDPRKYNVVLSVSPMTAWLSQSYMSIGTTGAPTTIPFTLPNNPAPPASMCANAGNFETRPVITINGPHHAPGIQLQSTGQIVSWSQVNLAAGDLMVIDCDSRMAWVNPGNVTLDVPLQIPGSISGYVAADVTSSWFPLHPGLDNVLLMSGTSVISDAGTMVVRSRDAWI